MADAASVPPRARPHIRAAVESDIPVLEALVERSARALSVGLYDAAEIDVLVATVFGVDSDLVADRSYYVAELDGAAAGCGGWSRHRTLFGGDRFGGRETGLLDPAVDAARIRAFFIDPAFARRGVAAALLDRCERAAGAAGFTALELMATLPGVPFYAAAGYVGADEVAVTSAGLALRFVPMRKVITARPDAVTATAS